MKYKIGDFVKLVYDYKTYKESIYVGKISKIDGYHHAGNKRNLNIILNPYVHYKKNDKNIIYGIDRRNDDGRFYLYDSIEKVVGIEESIFSEII